jgi:hypothetical protein
VGVLWLAGAAQGHDLAANGVPDDPGWRLGAAAAMAALHASEPVPEARQAGVLGMGSTWRDRRGLRLEHATLDAGFRPHQNVGAALALGLHDGDPVHVEAAWVEVRGAADAPGLALGAGRQRIPLGPAMEQAGHFERFALHPLIKRAAFEGDWVDDGAQLSWRPAQATFLRAVDLGVWRGRAFPGGGQSRAVPALHLAFGLADTTLDVFAARLRPSGRGTTVSDESAGHSHTAPDCGTSLSGVVCFDGRVRLLGGSLRWAPDHGPLSLTAALLSREERGSLYSGSGDTQYRGRTRGGWLDAVWRVAPRWETALRVERLEGVHDVQGPGAALVAQEAGLLPNRAGKRLAWATSFLADTAWKFNAELGTEQRLSGNHHYVLLRAVWSAPTLLQGDLP